MSDVRVDFPLDKLIEGLIVSGAQAAKIAGQAIMEEADVIADVSKDLCPVALDGGTLRSSFDMDTQPSIVGNKAVVEMGYGGSAKAYALRVHELLGDVNWTTPGTGAKYLERPVVEAGPDIASRIAKRFEEKLGKLT